MRRFRWWWLAVMSGVALLLYACSAAAVRTARSASAEGDTRSRIDVHAAYQPWQPGLAPAAATRAPRRSAWTPYEADPLGVLPGPLYEVPTATQTATPTRVYIPPTQPPTEVPV